MNIDKLLIEVIQFKLNENVELLRKSGLSNSHISELIESASENVLNDLKYEMWSELINCNK